MSRYIDADALVTDISFFDGDKYHYGYSKGMIESAPTVDAVPVVRCRECRYHIKEDDFEYWCNGFCQPARIVNPDDYCSHGTLKGCTIETCGYCENGLCYRAENAPKSRNCPFTKGEA